MKRWMKRLAPVLLSLVLVMGSCMTVLAADETENYCNMTETQWHEFLQSYVISGKPAIDTYPFYVATTSKLNYEYVIIYSDHALKYSDGKMYAKGYWAVAVYREGLFIPIASNAAGGSLSDYTNVSKYFSPTGVFIANHNINYLGLNDIFFHRAPLARMVLEIPLKEIALKEVVGLLPLLMPFLVLVASFWKGYRFLSTILRKA